VARASHLQAARARRTRPRRILVEVEHKRGELDAASFYVLHYKLMSRLLVRAHRVVAANL